MSKTATYAKIANTTLGSAQSSVTFNSFSGYTDLILVCCATTATDDQFLSVRFNGDSGSNYSNTYMTGDGTTASSGRNAGTVAYIAGNSSNTTPSGVFSILLGVRYTTLSKLIPFCNFLLRTSAKKYLYLSAKTLPQVKHLTGMIIVI
jgi:hypothetical protein